MTKTVYRSRIDWWIWCLMFFALVVAWVASIGTSWWTAAPVAIGTMGIFIVLVLGYRYEIDGDTLTVYQLFMPHRYPIRKITTVRKTTGYLTTAGMSSRRVSIQFSDRSVLRRSTPLEISPRDRDGFMASLKAANPDIKVIG